MCCQSAHIDEKAIRRDKPEELVKALAEAKVRTSHGSIRRSQRRFLFADCDELVIQILNPGVFLARTECLYCRPTPLS